MLVLGFSMPAMAGHIDQLGIKITLNSSDGNGNFTVLFQEFMGSDGWMWSNPWQANYNTPGITASLLSGPGSINDALSFDLDFKGLVNAAGVATAGYGIGQIGTQFVNNVDDAAVYSAIVAFTINGFDKTQQYLVSLKADDCCYVVGDGVSYDGTLTFDPRAVVGVPAPSTIAIMLLAVFGLLLRRVKHN